MAVNYLEPLGLICYVISVIYVIILCYYSVIYVILICFVIS